MKTFVVLLTSPLSVLLSSLMGAMAIYYMETTAVQAVYWFIPCLAVIIADLSAGIRAARWRGENIRFSGAIRRTLNKCMCYVSWIICCVALNERYDTSMCAWVGMSFIFLIEGISFFSNLLEPHGIKLSVSGILRIVGDKSRLDGLENIIQKEDGTEAEKDSEEK